MQKTVDTQILVIMHIVMHALSYLPINGEVPLIVVDGDLRPSIFTALTENLQRWPPSMWKRAAVYFVEEVLPPLTLYLYSSDPQQFVAGAQIKCNFN